MLEPGTLAVMNVCFDHEKLDVYRASIDFVLVVDEVVKIMPRGRELLLRIVAMLTKLAR